jgi:hypothetical protein
VSSGYTFFVRYLFLLCMVRPDTTDSILPYRYNRAAHLRWSSTRAQRRHLWVHSRPFAPCPSGGAQRGMAEGWMDRGYPCSSDHRRLGDKRYGKKRSKVDGRTSKDGRSCDYRLATHSFGKTWGFQVHNDEKRYARSAHSCGYG